jgi:hypothetical protein
MPDTDVRLSVDSEVLEAIRRPQTNGFSWEKLGNVVKVVALILGGLGAYHTYATFTKKSNELALQAAEAHLEESKLARERAKFEIEKSRIEVGKMSQAPVTTAERLRIEPLRGTNNYYVSYDYSFLNSGSGQVTILCLMAESFLARSPANAAAVLVNDPGDDGALKWEPKSLRGFLDIASWKPGIAVMSGRETASAEEGGGGTGTINSGESLDGNIALLVNGKPSDFVGFRIRYAVYSLDGDGKLKLVSNTERLLNFSPLGIVQEKETK